MNKAEVSASYMERMKAEHTSKPYPTNPLILITGTSRSGSIGEEIAARFEKIRRLEGDVRDGEFDFEGAGALILCHGAVHMDWLEDAPEHKIREVIDVNLTGSIRMIRNFVRATLHAPYRKRIISIGSMAHRAVLNGSAPYCASKAGLAHFIRCAAWELAPKGYDVYAVHPSNTEGAPMSEDTIRGLMRYRNLSRAEAEAYWGAVLPRERWLNTGDIADLVEFLVRGNSAYLSGAQLELAGGQR